MGKQIFITIYKDIKNQHICCKLFNNIEEAYYDVEDKDIVRVIVHTISIELQHILNRYRHIINDISILIDTHNICHICPLVYIINNRNKQDMLDCNILEIRIQTDELLRLLN